MSNPIGWCTETVNCITGCLNSCPYCYARKMANRLKGRYGYPADEPFRPTFHPDKLEDIRNLKGKGKRVFLDSMSDWFSLGVDESWIAKTLDVVRFKPDHTFLILTKRPERIPDNLPIRLNTWIGVSVTCQDDVWRIDELKDTPFCNLFVSFEPLHGPISCDLSGIEWVIIGAESGNRKGKITPEESWIESIIYPIEGEIPIYMKDNLKPYLYMFNLVQDFPEAMR
jgi:protein gp37